VYTGGGLYVRMSKQLLNHSQISAGSEGQGRKGMTATMDGQTAHVGVYILQITEELAVVPREIPGMPHFTARRTEYKLTDTG